MKKNFKTILSIILLIPIFSNAQTHILQSQLTVPTNLLSTNQICVSVNNLIKFKNTTQVFYIDSVKFKHQGSNNYLLEFHTRDSTSTCNIAPYITSNYNYCFPALPTGTYNITSAELNYDKCNSGATYYFLGNYSLNITCGGTVTYNSISVSGCDTILYKNNYYTSNTIKIDTLINSSNCDSILTANIIVKHKSNNPIIYDTLCYSSNYLLPNNTTIYNVKNDTILNLNYSNQQGCDSNYIFKIKVHNQNIVNIIDTICQGSSYVIGSHAYINAGIYKDTVTASNGCDSIINLNLSIQPKLDTTIVQIGNSLFANQPLASYQWINCSTNQILNGQINQFYTPTNSGSYATILIRGACIDTTICFNFVATALDEIKSINEILIYPNPNNGKFQITNYDIEKITLINNIGQTVFDNKNKSILEFLDLSYLNDGIYFLHITTKNNNIKNYKLIIKK